MDDDSAQPQKAPDDGDEACSEQARRFMEEYAAELREMCNVLRKLINGGRLN